MTNTLQVFRANPGVMIVTSLMILANLVFGFIAFIMTRSGVSLRPLIFFAGFFAMVVGPQALFHYSQTLGWIPKQDRWTLV